MLWHILLGESAGCGVVISCPQVIEACQGILCLGIVPQAVLDCFLRIETLSKGSIPVFIFDLSAFSKYIADASLPVCDVIAVPAILLKAQIFISIFESAGFCHYRNNAPCLSFCFPHMPYWKHNKSAILVTVYVII